MTRRIWPRATFAGLVAGFLTASLLGTGGAVIQTDAAHAATDAELTSSAVTLTNKDHALEPDGAPFPDLEVTISQTKDLVSQGIRVSWKGGKKSTVPSGNVGGTNFLQLAQCWGEDPENEGHPDRRTCQYGGTLGWGASRDGFVETKDVAEEDLPFTHVDPTFATYTGIPFVATNPAGIVDEKLAPADRVVNALTTDEAGNVVQKTGADAVALGTNQFFTAFTTNEVKWAAAGADGSGSVPFEVQTAMQSTGLGCGAPITKPDNTVVGQSCWLVVIPRGTGDSGSSLITQPGLWWDAWEHHIAVKLEFKPLGVRCEIGAAERQLAGSELVSIAMGSWQPALCAGENGSPFVLSAGSEADAVARAAGTEPSPLAFTSQPLDLSRVGESADPVAYAPVALSAVAISFAIDRQPHPQNASPEEKARAGLPMTEMKLTPRLVAKLLTASYVDTLPNGADKSHIGYINFREPGKNPRTLLQDPEFLELNDPEWAKQIITSASVADMLTPSGRSDTAQRLWEYALSDPEARKWLDGTPDENGMIVNPWYSTNPEINPTDEGLALPTQTFPKADPVEKPDTTVTDPANGTGPINLVTNRPYTHSLADGAYHVLRGDGMTLGGWNKDARPPKWDSSVRELYGSQKVIGLTSTPAAELYQTVTASLRNPAGEFVSPTQDSLAAAAAAMTPIATQSAVMMYDLSGASAKAATSSYPLTMPVYAALNPKQTDAELRAVYADLIRYAAQQGQQPGTDIGELPPGYAPLPPSWVTLALAAADVIERGGVPAAAPPATGSVGGSDTPSALPTIQQQQPAGAPPTTDPVVTDPVVTGTAAGELTGAATPQDPELGPMAAAVPIGLAAGFATALAVPVVSRVRRRA